MTEPQRQIIVVAGFLVLDCIVMWNTGWSGWAILAVAAAGFWVLDAIEFKRFE
jgi:hypothetical protein